ncbi:Uma2 family endonuclease [Dyadobacter frigoris]|uniref:Uma2 family endonuclease n=1 Tax=Dyadobacter frigoris TaxID=2576211 RepID=A0A4U6DA82_9BACT|nr:Uma2 family endonuclease [Dyadobacter frigoris]TKT91164.1 Uma2 family endonuclease [Dyadobacter frigoris]GLU55093.1 restriction endonuclease [Dyadobacter frigoris]
MSIGNNPLILNPCYKASDLQKLPDGPPYYELISGNLSMSPSPTYQHQRILREIFFALHKFVNENNLGEVLCAPLDVEFDDMNVYQPDIFFISKTNSGIIKDSRITGAPDLGIEILFGNKYHDLNTKRYSYEIFGVREFWLVDPQEKTVEILENLDMEFLRFSYAKHEGIVKSKILNGFSIEINDLLG